MGLVNGCEGRETGPSLSLALSPDLDVLLLHPETHPGPSSARAEDNESLESGIDYELPTSERSERDDKAQGGCSRPQQQSLPFF